MALFSTDVAAKLAALDRSQAVIEFALDGTILTANANFLATAGYGLEEVQGQHHRMLVDPAERESEEYRAFWAALRRGEFQAAEFRRIVRGDQEIWIQATYNPILDPAERPIKVGKFATKWGTDHRLSLMNDCLRDLGAATDPIKSGLVGLVGDADLRRLETEGTIRHEVAWAQTEGGAIHIDAVFSLLRTLDGRIDRILMCGPEVTPQRRTVGDTNRALTDVLDKIGQIVGSIDGIASQANLLALNATFEAARAGEAERGFAVIATEVRDLAGRSTQATGQIGSLVVRAASESDCSRTPSTRRRRRWPERAGPPRCADQPRAIAAVSLSSFGRLPTPHHSMWKATRCVAREADAEEAVLGSELACGAPE